MSLTGRIWPTRQERCWHCATTLKAQEVRRAVAAIPQRRTLSGSSGLSVSAPSVASAASAGSGPNPLNRDFLLACFFFFFFVTDTVSVGRAGESRACTPTASIFAESSRFSSAGAVGVGGARGEAMAMAIGAATAAMTGAWVQRRWNGSSQESTEHCRLMALVCRCSSFCGVSSCDRTSHDLIEHPPCHPYTLYHIMILI